MKAFLLHLRPSLRWLWPVLLVGSIVYAAGPNGAWMSQQFVDPVPPAWGWFGAVLLGLAVFGGIKFAVAGRRIGIAIAGVGGVLAVVVDSQYFAAAGHDPVMAGLLGVFPTLLAVLAGIVEGIEATTTETAAEREDREQKEREAEEARLRLEWELREAAKDRAAARRAGPPGGGLSAVQRSRGTASTSSAAVTPVTPVTPASQDSGQDSTVSTSDKPKPSFSDETKRAAIGYIQELAGEVSAADLAARFNVTERTGRRYLAAYRRNGYSHKEPTV